MAFKHLHLVIMTRLPLAGTTKTRLIPALGAEGAAKFHEKLVRHTILHAKAFCAEHGYQLTLKIAGGDASEARDWLREPNIEYREQCSGDLGDRLIDASQEAFNSGAEQVLIIGTDCPSIRAPIYAQAIESLNNHDVVIGPATDGGYYLIGLNQPSPSLFQNISWSTEKVLNQTENAARKAEFTLTRLEILPDVDRPEDIAHAEKELSNGV